MDRKLRMGMVGGGKGAFIGRVHRMASALDGKIELVAGAFSSNSEKSRESGKELHLDPSRVYGSYQEMAEKEAALPADQRIDFVSIVTPNNAHIPAAETFIKAGINVVCDKPMAFSLEQALEFRKLVKESGKVFALTHNYTGYPCVKHARWMVQEGMLGDIWKIVVEYPQGHALNDLGSSDANEIAGWRHDPKVSGVSCCMGDIGTHAENLARYISGLKISEICAELSTFMGDRPLDDDGNCLVRWEKGCKGVLYASQISNGEENDVNIRVYGTKASIEWHQEEPNELLVKRLNQPHEVIRRGNPYLCDQAKKHTRIPFGHPEAFIEAFANIYMEAAEAIWDEVNGRFKDAADYDFPNVDDGVIGNAFIETCVESSKSETKWTQFPAV